MIGPFCRSILLASIKKQYSSFLKKVFVYQKICFKVKVLKTFETSTDCHIKKMPILMMIQLRYSSTRTFCSLGCPKNNSPIFLAYCSLECELLIFPGPGPQTMHKCLCCAVAFVPCHLLFVFVILFIVSCSLQLAGALYCSCPLSWASYTL